MDSLLSSSYYFFFFQAEDGIRDIGVTGVQTCALPIWRAMSSVAFAVSCASSLTSLATTAKPLPASPARAASIVALSASRLVCSAIELITEITLPTCAEDSPSLTTVALVASAAPTACAATVAALAAFCAISRIDADISSVPVATVCTLRDTCSAAADTNPACDADSCADPDI